jgi:hypothetical protein
VDPVPDPHRQILCDDTLGSFPNNSPVPYSAFRLDETPVHIVTNVEFLKLIKLDPANKNTIGFTC